MYASKRAVRKAATERQHAVALAELQAIEESSPEWEAKFDEVCKLAWAQDPPFVVEAVKALPALVVVGVAAVVDRLVATPDEDRPTAA